MDYSIEKKYDSNKNEWNIIVNGEIDIFNSEEFKSSLLSLELKDTTNLVIDCKDLNYLDSTALGSLVTVLKFVKTKNGDVIIKNLKASLFKLFKITNLDTIFKIEVI